MVPKPNYSIHIVLSTMIEEVSMYHSWLNLFQANLVLNPFPNKKLCGETHMCTVWHQISEYNNGPWMFVCTVKIISKTIILIFISIAFIFILLYITYTDTVIHILWSPDVKQISIIFTRRMPWQNREINMGRTFIDTFDIGFQCVPKLKYLSHLFHKIEGNKKLVPFLRVLVRGFLSHWGYHEAIETTFFWISRCCTEFASWENGISKSYILHHCFGSPLSPSNVCCCNVHPRERNHHLCWGPIAC